MPPLFAPQAFERFTRADAARHGPGAGLGLAIVDLVARAHGGETFIEQDTTHCEIGIRIPVAGASSA
jgi:signal transduction histidine kinase